MKVVELPLNTPIKELTAKTLVQFPDSVGVLERTNTSDSPGVRLILHLADGRQQRAPIVADTRAVGEVVATLLAREPLRIFQLPPGTIRRTYLPDPKVPAMARYIALAAVPVGAVVASLGGVLGWYLATCAVAGLITWWRLFRRLPPSVTFVSRGQASELLRLLPADSGEEPQRIVDDVKAEYGRLLSDIAYRIEFPALFDVREPATEALTLALFEWDAPYVQRTSLENADLAVRIRSAFQAARLHAERRGLSHYPNDVRDRAVTALGVARLATSPSTSQGERAAAMRRTIALLEGLALYYLPTPEQARIAINGGELKQLPGRPS